MSLRHLFGSEDWYVIGVDHGRDEGRPGWWHRKQVLVGPGLEASASWNIGGEYRFGWGFKFGINGGESDCGLDIFLGRFVKAWLRLRAPWTRWMRLSPERFGYDARHFGVVLFPHDGCWLRIECFNTEGRWSRKQPWWYEVKFGSTQLWGRTRSTTDILDSGVCRIPLPEGVYMATWERRRYTKQYVRFPGTLRRARSHELVDLDIQGGIPFEGKGENSWDQDMDGLFGCSGRTLEDAIGHAVSSVLRNRQRYGGPHDLDRPMTVKEASSR